MRASRCWFLHVIGQFLYHRAELKGDVGASCNINLVSDRTNWLVNRECAARRG